MLSSFLSRRSRSTEYAPPERVEETPSGDVRTRSVTAELTALAHASVDLAALGPQLATLAAEIENQAQTQAQRASAVAASMAELAQDLERAVGELRGSSGQMRDALKTVERIADHTRLLSVNASIEAARAGEAGRAFSVVVDEVKRLADSSGQSTRLIEERMSEIDASVTRVSAVTTPNAADRETDRRTVGAMNQQVRHIADSAQAQLGSARSAHAMGGRINQLTESLLLTVGRFRFDAHAHAQRAVSAVLPELVAAISSRARLEQRLKSWLEANAYFELGYVTDAAGRQIVDNFRSQAGRVTCDPSGFGRDWSDRPWYRAAVEQGGVRATDIYRSTATGDFCFTVTAALTDEHGALVGVFGSDVNFQRLVRA